MTHILHPFELDAVQVTIHRAPQVAWASRQSPIRSFETSVSDALVSSRLGAYWRLYQRSPRAHFLATLLWNKLDTEWHP